MTSKHPDDGPIPLHPVVADVGGEPLSDALPSVDDAELADVETHIAGDD